MLPSGKLVGASLEVLATLQLSAVVGVPRVTFVNAVLQAPASTFTVTADGAAIVGSVLSTTVTVAVPEDEFPAASVAVSVTVFAPKSEQVKDVTSRDNVKLPLLSVVPLSISEVAIVPFPKASSGSVTS